MTEPKPLTAGILDFNPKRMPADEAVQRGIPPELQTYLADYRQYPCNIALNFPDEVSWFSPDQEWFFASVMSDPEKVARLKESDLLILSGSGLSAYRYQENDPRITPENAEHLKKAQEVVTSILGQGKWVLGICFGGQLAVHAVGGEIGRLPENEHKNTVTEAGWLSHTLTEDGKNDEVFGKLPETFYAPHLHNDFVASLPAIGTKVETEAGIITVTRAEVLAFRDGYLDKDGLKNSDTRYTHACLIEFDNGARLYQIQPHPEMANSQEKINFLVRQNGWVGHEAEMGEEYYERCLAVPAEADLSVAGVITTFTEQAKEHLEKQGRIFVDAVVGHNFEQYLLK